MKKERYITLRDCATTLDSDLYTARCTKNVYGHTVEFLFTAEPGCNLVQLTIDGEFAINEIYSLTMILKSVHSGIKMANDTIYKYLKNH